MANISLRSGNSNKRRSNNKVRYENANDITITKVFSIILAVSALLVGIYIQLTKNFSETLEKSPHRSENGFSDKILTHDTLVVADNLDAGYLDHIVDALLNYGHKLSFAGSPVTPLKIAHLKSYDLIWTHDYPFQEIRNLGPLQRINHFPGTGFITNKLTLSTTPMLPHTLKAFRLPAEQDRFLMYIKESPNKLWIQKKSSHRAISIVTATNVNLNLDETLVQEYMSNPLLIDGRKFDIGIYAVLTSVDPLRVYTYEAESLLRFCAQPYIDKRTRKFNPSIIDSYVIGDHYTPIWLMPSLLRHYVGANLSMKQTLNAFLRQRNMNGTKIWHQIEETIKSIYMKKEHHIARLSRLYQELNGYNSTSVRGSLNQFFEIVRFDFIVDENLNVFLMEANMSPNLSSRHFPPNRLLYEQVLNSYFSLAGLGQYANQHLTTNLPINYLNGSYQKPLVHARSKDNENRKYGLDELISDKELAVYEDLCVSDECHMNCDKVDCKICFFCLSYADKLHLRRGIYEQNFKWNFKRLLPSTHDEEVGGQLTNPGVDGRLLDSNYIHVHWFRGKCHSDRRFCSY